MTTLRAIRNRKGARGRTVTGLLVLVAGALALASAASAETWRGLVVAPEHRCSRYDRKRDYPYRGTRTLDPEHDHDHTRPRSDAPRRHGVWWSSGDVNQGDVNA